MTATSPSVSYSENPYFQDALGQPEALLRLLGVEEQIRAIAKELNFDIQRRVVLSGMGSSHFATYPLWQTLVSSGFNAWWLDGSELLQVHEELLSEGDIVLLTSQSGESGETLQLLSELNEGVLVVGITNNPNSTLALSANKSIEIFAGPEATVSTKSLINTVATIRMLSDVLAMPASDKKRDLRISLQSISDFLEKFEEHIFTDLDFARNKKLLITGRGEAAISAELAALILKEASKIACEGMSGGKLRHGPIELADENLAVLFFNHGDQIFTQQNLVLAEQLHENGAEIGWVGPGCPDFAMALPSPSNQCDPMLRDILAFQALSFAIATREGIEAGTFRAARKITSIV
jgi:glucosamine--fructose-6-phosphate aminotransferase (isomerizing)